MFINKKIDNYLSYDLERIKGICHNIPFILGVLLLITGFLTYKRLGINSKLLCALIVVYIVCCIIDMRLANSDTRDVSLIFGYLSFVSFCISLIFICLIYFSDDPFARDNIHLIIFINIILYIIIAAFRLTYLFTRIELPKYWGTIKVLFWGLAFIYAFFVKAFRHNISQASLQIFIISISLYFGFLSKDMLIKSILVHIKFHRTNKNIRSSKM